MPTLFSEYKLKMHTVRNRVVFPPVVCFHYAGGDGLATERNITHYQEIAKGGSGIVITEATAVMEEGRLAPFQLGLWSDDHIPGMSRIASAVKQAGAVSLVQIHHAGLLTNETVSAVARGPSADPARPGTAELTTEETQMIISAFISAAVRARQAGYDGVELHGAHGYLLNEFASAHYNRRTDPFGGTTEARMKVATRIIKGIRDACGDDFIIGYRMGANSPTLDEGIVIARHLEAHDVDILHVSHGGNLLNLPRTPAGFEYNWIVYSGTVVREQVQIPVIAVNEIRTPERASWLVEHGKVDFVALGRPQLADPEWVNHVRNNQSVRACFSCRPKCRWYEDSSRCPAREVGRRT